jgi:hypothetical protein
MTKEQFLSNVSSWNDHLPLLWLALQETKGSVAEFGSGDGSTPYLREYCKDTEREFFTYDNSPEWCHTTGSTFVNWSDASLYREYDVCLIDHAPGELRHEAIAILKDKVKIIVIHDSEPIGCGNYKLHKIWHLFKYIVHLKSEGAWATAVSNHIDVTKWAGQELAGFKIDV